MKRLLLILSLLLPAPFAMAQQSTCPTVGAGDLQQLEYLIEQHRRDLLLAEAATDTPFWIRRSDGTVTVLDGNAHLDRIMFVVDMAVTLGVDARLPRDTPDFLRRMLEAAVAGNAPGRVEIGAAYLAHSRTVRAETLANLDQNLQAVRQRMQQREGQVAAVIGIDQWGTTGTGSELVAGEIHFRPPSDGRVDYFVAQDGFARDLRSFGYLVFDKQSSQIRDGSYADPYDWHGYGDVALFNGDMRASYTIQEHHDGTWCTFRVPLADSDGWRLEGGAQSLSDVLVNVTEIHIRGEYGAGDDQAALRNIHFE